MKKGFLEALKDKKEQREKELEALKKAIEIVERDAEWEYIMNVYPLI